MIKFKLFADRDDRIEERHLRLIRHTDKPSVLLRIWRRSPYADVRVSVIHKLRDQSALAYIARHENMESLRCEAVIKLRDRSLLFAIAQEDDSQYVRYSAQRMLMGQERWDAAYMDENAERALVMMLEHNAWLNQLVTGRENSEELW